MKTAGTAFLAVLVISSLGIWGCAQQKNSAQARKIGELEERYGKLEEEYRSVVMANETTRKKITKLELQKVELSQQVEDLRALVQDRDDLKQKLATRTNERDAVRTQLAQFSKDLQNFASRVEAVASANPPANPNVTANGSAVVLPVMQKTD